MAGPMRAGHALLEGAAHRLEAGHERGLASGH
jgi:hypothetical protein